jgi:hypothetical protein
MIIQGIQRIALLGVVTCILTLRTSAEAVGQGQAANLVAAPPIVAFPPVSEITRQSSHRIVRCPPIVESRPLSEITLDVRPPDVEQLPDRASQIFQAADEALPPRAGWYCRRFGWAAPEFWRGPLYFDDVPLERYGQSWHPLLQPVKSGAHFFGSLPILPYKVGIDRPCDRISNLGYYRVGSCVPGVRQRLPLEADATLLETGAWVAAFLLLP